MTEKGRSPWKVVVLLVPAIIVALGLSFYFLKPWQKGPGGIEGTVTDQKGKPLPGMVVCIVSGTTGFPEIAVLTNEEGYYQIGSVPSGTFEVGVHDRRGNRIGLESVTVRGGEDSTLNFAIPTPTSVQVDFEEAVGRALVSSSIGKWSVGEYRWLGEFEGEPFVTSDGLVEGFFEWRASNGTLYEAEYPSGEVYGEIERFTGVEDTEEYYVWGIVFMDGSSRHVDARSGEVLSLSPSRTPDLLTFEAAVRITRAPQRKVDEWNVQRYERLGFELEPHETPDGLVKGHLLWRVGNGTLFEVQIPSIQHAIGRVLYIEDPNDVEEYNVWEITNGDNVYYIDARDGTIRLILEA